MSAVIPMPSKSSEENKCLDQDNENKKLIWSIHLSVDNQIIHVYILIRIVSCGSGFLRVTHAE